jgi:hypothetical protein
MLKGCLERPSERGSPKLSGGRRLLLFFRSHAEAKPAAFPEAGSTKPMEHLFKRDAEFCDAELLALALRSCLRSGIDPSKLDQFFLRISLGSQGLAKASLAHFKESCSACG